MTTRVTAVYLLFNILVFALIASYYVHALTPRYRRRLTWLAAFCGVTVVGVTGFALQFPLPLRVGGILVVETVLLTTLFSDSLWRKLICLVVQWLCMVVGECGTALVLHTVLRIPSMSAMQSGDNRVYLVASLIYPAAYSLGLLAVRNLPKLTDKRAFIRYGIFLFSQILAIFCLLYVILTKIQIGSGYLLAVALCLLAELAVDVIFIRITREAARKQQLEEENRFLLRQRELELEHYEALIEQQDAVRRMRHDIVNHLQTIRSMLSEGEEAQAHRYAGELLGEYSRHATVDYCDNRVVDAVLHNKVELARAKGIRCTVRVRLGQELPVRELDLVSVFSNLLDNAIRSCSLCAGERELSVAAGIRVGFLTVRVENTKGSEEPPREGHGLGHVILRDIAGRYGGVFECWQEAGRFIAVVTMSVQGLDKM